MITNVEERLPELASFAKTAGVTRVANITGLDTVGIPVVLAVRPNSRSLSVSQGKGLTPPLAKISALMESLEQFHAERPRVPLTLASYRELKVQADVVDVRRLPKTPRQLDEDTRLLWTPAVEFKTGRRINVPYELVHLDLTEPLPEGSGYFLLGSNGLASGFDFEQALAHGAWEVVERDAITLFYELGAKAQSARRLRLASVDDAACHSLIRQMRAADLGVAVWDLTTDLSIATFLCSIGERRFEPLRPVGTARGYGTHPERAVALRRALTEAAQSRLTRIAGSRDDIQMDEFEAVRSHAAVERQRLHVEQETFAERGFAEVPSRSFTDHAEALAWTNEKLRFTLDTSLLYVDLSPSNAPISVVRSIVPGLEGYCGAPSYVPGERALRARSLVAA
jgi:ribosomal protein S12 methylthiotransferase accessory factor